jgi:thiamine-phosphate pyrophosphorylase
LALTYYITSRKLLADSVDDAGLLASLAQKVRAAFRAGVSYVQLREKDLPGARLASLTEMMAAFPEKESSRLLVNDRLDVALSCGADGVHLPADSISPAAVRTLAGHALAGVSCHNGQEVAEASRNGASYVLVGPVFETPSKPGVEPLGLKAFGEICGASAVPVFALGGVTRGNAEKCMEAGASGVAGIRLFQEALDLEELCRYLHSLAAPDGGDGTGHRPTNQR